MYDTVVASIDFNLSPKSEMSFPQFTRVDNVLRFWRNPVGEAYEPRLTYMRGIDWQDGKLRVEFSVPKMLGLSYSDNPTQAQTAEALDLVDDWLADLLEEALPLVRFWSAQRIDYAWNFQPTGGVAEYIALLQGLWLGSMTRHPFPDAEGVVWKSRQHSHRWVKFYNKAIEAASGGTPTLRFEVSNYRRSLTYMCEKWFDCPRTVGELLRPGRALYCMARMWSKLGLFAAEYHADGLLLLKLKKLFGRGAAGALYALQAIRMYGADAHKVYGLLSDNAYYAWKHKLNAYDLLVQSDVYLPPLSLPASFVLKQLSESEPQNLNKNSSPHRERGTKIPPKNWQMWVKELQVSKNSPEIGRLTGLLELSWEQIYGKSSAAQELGGMRSAGGRARIKAAS